MIKIPSTNKKYSQTNKSDLLGNIWYTKNINFDEEGYIKLSPRAISLLTEQTDGNLGLPVSFGRVSEGEFNISTLDREFSLTIGDFTGAINITTDGGSGVPSLSSYTYGLWFNKLWHVTTSTKLWYKTQSSGAWTDSGISLTSGVSHPLCGFEKSGTLLVGNGNAIKQIDTSYSVGSYSQLTISSDYEIIGIAYNNNQAAIATRLASTVEGENKEAGLFIWDGSESSANAMYKVGSDACLAVFPYKSSFVVLTRSGQLKYFNGGGFEDLASFPVYYKDVVWGDFINKLSYGDNIKVDGDLIYININSTINGLGYDFIEEMSGGIWVYDPSIGLYHRTSPSISETTAIYSRAEDFDLTNNKISVYTYDIGSSMPETGNPVVCLSSGSTDFVYGNVYWIIKSSPTQYKLATSKENALSMIGIDLTNSGIVEFLTINLKDYSQSFTGKSGGISFFGSKAYSHDDFIFGSETYDYNSTTKYDNLNITIPQLRNIGYYITPKISSSVIEDSYKNIFNKFKPLNKDSSIIIKYKTKEYLGLPTIADCSVISSTVITTTEDISKAYNLFSTIGEDIECEIIAGSGGGQMSKVSSITYDTGTYTITLEDIIDGFASGDKCTIKLDNWTTIGTATNSDTMNWKENTISSKSKWIKFKVILDGYDITMEELQINNTPHTNNF